MRVVEHNIRVLAKYYTRISMQHFADLLHLDTKVTRCHVVLLSITLRFCLVDSLLIEYSIGWIVYRAADTLSVDLNFTPDYLAFFQATFSFQFQDETV